MKPDPHLESDDVALRKVFICIIRIITMKGPYEFLQPLAQLKAAYHSHQRAISVLNAIILSVALYCLAEISGIPDFMDFYYRDSQIIAKSPAVLCALLGILMAVLIKRRRTGDVFPLLGQEMSEKARTAYDNRDSESLPMRSLALELASALKKIRPSDILDSKQIQRRVLAIVLLTCAVIFLVQSGFSDHTNFQKLAELRNDVLKNLEEEEPKINESIGINLTGNIWGKPSLAVLGENRMEIKIYPGQGAGSLARSSEPVERAFQKSDAGEASPVSSELYIESLPPENRDIIKKYFMYLSESETE